MALDLEARLKQFLASAPQNIHAVQTLEISHRAMPRTYYLWREPYFGEITTESGIHAVQPINLEIKLAGTENNLDQRFDIKLDLVDIADEFRAALDAVPIATLEKIRVTYREYLSDDLTAPLATSVLQAESVSYQIGVAAITAVSPRLSIVRTGENYNPRDIPPLRGFL